MANGTFAGGDGSLSNPFLIEDAYDLAAINNDSTAAYKLTKNIDMTQFCNETDGTGWTPLNQFRGNFNGAGYTIRNLFINRTSANNQALFSSLRGGYIGNVGVVNCNITGGANYTAALVGQTTTLEDVIENCFSTGSITGTSDVGGLVGRVVNGDVINCYSEANITVSGSDVGGITSNVDGTYANVKNCFYAGTITGGSSNKNGVVGYFSSGGNMTNCFYDSTKNPITGTGAKVMADMQTPATFAAWNDQYYNYDKPTWVLRNGSYPRLFYTEATKYFIFVDSKYKTFKNGIWTDVTTTFPTQDMFDSLGINDFELSMIPRFKWNELREFGSFDLVANTDKYAVDRSSTKVDLVYDSQISDAVVLKTAINFADYGDSINRIRILQ